MVDFVAANGALKAYGILAALTAGAFLAVPVLQIFGHRFRSISGPVPHALPNRASLSKNLHTAEVSEITSPANAYESEDMK